MNSVHTVGLPRRPGLGRYSGTRTQWIDAYRAARARKRCYSQATVRARPLLWKAQLVVFFERDCVDRLTIPLAGRLVAHKLIEEMRGGS